VTSAPAHQLPTARHVHVPNNESTNNLAPESLALTFRPTPQYIEKPPPVSEKPSWEIVNKGATGTLLFENPNNDLAPAATPSVSLPRFIRGPLIGGSLYSTASEATRYAQVIAGRGGVVNGMEGCGNGKSGYRVFTCWQSNLRSFRRGGECRYPKVGLPN
jgi:hypothetical protein